VVTLADIVKGLREVGVVLGDTVMFHSSLSSMGTVMGGPDTVIDGFLEAVGPTGTVAVPTLCNWTVEDQHLVFKRWDPETSPSYVGRITEAFRLRPEAMRSDHATHSVAAIGARAKELTDRHGASGWRASPFGQKAFARESPWQRLFDWNAAYCFIGVTFRVNTMVHFIESLIVERALKRASRESRAKLAVEVAGWMQPGVWPQIEVGDREAIERILAGRGLVRYAKIGSATLRCIRARPMVEAWVSIVESDPDRWFPESFRRWLERGQLGGNREAFMDRRTCPRQ